MCSGVYHDDNLNVILMLVQSQTHVHTVSDTVWGYMLMFI